MNSKATCPLCGSRKGRRACPALGQVICAQCCGAKRRVEIRCPDDCVYLDGAQAGAWDGRETEKRRDLRRVAAHTGELSREQAELFFVSLVGLAGLRARRNDLDDRLLALAFSALRKTAETRESGVLYDHPPADARAVGLVADLRQMFEARTPDGKNTAPADRDLLPVLRALEASLLETLKEQAGPCTFLDAAARLAGRIAPVRGEAQGPLIVTP
jgi:hypothetical protein